MKFLKEILTRIFLLIADMIFFILATARKTVLPGKYRKGNLLSTVFTLFLGICERVIVFEKAIFNKRLFKHPVFRQGFIIVTSLLFLLTALEWPDATAGRISFSSAVQTEVHTPVISKESAAKFSGIFIADNKSFTTSPANIWLTLLEQSIHRMHIYLLVRNIRI